MYHLPCVCCTLVSEIRVRPEMLHVIQYIDVLTCVIYNCMHSTEQQSTRVCREDYRRRQVHVGECTDTWYKQIQPTETVDLKLPGNLPMACYSACVLFVNVHVDP